MRFVAISALLALLIATAVNQAIGYLAYTPRPFLAGLGNQFIEHRDSSSLPSNHATIFFTSAAILLIFGKRKLGLLAAFLGLLVAWSRIYLGIHYPFDMGAAAMTSLVAALAAAWLMRLLGASLLVRLDWIYDRAFGSRARRVRPRHRSEHAVASSPGCFRPVHRCGFGIVLARRSYGRAGPPSSRAPSPRRRISPSFGRLEGRSIRPRRTSAKPEISDWSYYCSNLP